jgi:hypothetical protein
MRIRSNMLRFPSTPFPTLRVHKVGRMESSIACLRVPTGHFIMREWILLPSVPTGRFNQAHGASVGNVK